METENSVKFVENAEIKLMDQDKRKNFVSAIRATRSTKAPHEILTEINEKLAQDPEYLNKSVEVTAKHTLGAGHGAAGDELDYFISFKNLPRTVSILMNRLPYGVGPLAQTTRHTKISHAFIPEILKEKGLYDEAKSHVAEIFAAYNSFQNRGATTQDSMFVLPLCLAKNLTFKANFRGLVSFYIAATGGEGTIYFDKMVEQNNGKKPEITRPQVVKDVGNQVLEILRKEEPAIFKDRGANFEPMSLYPGLADFYEHNPMLNQIIESDVVEPIKQGKTQAVMIEYSNPFKFNEKDVEEWIQNRNQAFLDCLPNITGKFVAQLNLAAIFDWRRHRSIRVTYESLVHAANNFTYHVPVSIKNAGLQAEFDSIMKKEIEFYRKLIANGVPTHEAVSFLPHGIKLYMLMTMDGWNMLFYALGLRLCTKARPDIGEFAEYIATAIKEKDPLLGKFIGPRGTFYRNGCPEIEPCGKCEQILKGRKGD
jgi:thymidylate synthase ThyX